MKKLLLTGLMVAILGIGNAYAIDSTKHVRIYADEGRTAGYVTNQGLNAVLDADGNYGIPTTNRYQLQRNVMSIPITLASAGEDTVWTNLFSVPTGQTITIEEIRLTAVTELSGTNDSSWGQILYHRNSGDTLLILDTCVARFANDADSAVYDDTLLTLTLIDSVFNAGSIIQYWQDNQKGAATGGEGASLTILYRRDE